MGLLLLDRAQLEIKSEGDTLALYEAGERRGTVPLKLIDRCVIQGGQTRLDSGVLMKLADAGATTVLMSPRYPRRIAIVLGDQHNDAAVRLAQAMRVMDVAWCQNWALGVVRAKLARQQRALRTLQDQRPDARKPLFDALQTVTAISANLNAYTSADSNATEAYPTFTPTLESLRGHEGAAARAYFAGLAGVMPPALHFTGRNRRPPRDPVNACLSLGYTLLHAQAVQACGIVGLDPLLGFYHRPAFGRESLASDLIEALRPAVDLWVWELVRSRTLTEDHFTTSPDQAACLLGKAGRSIYYASWNDHCKPWQRWLRAQAQALARNLRGTGAHWMAHGPAKGEDVWD
ncbi:MAG: CRISPR-associated endonuclease Cas1 [Rhodoferax sp.]|nr:CRISPR-associated endonuclease Cas1 [Rhodoferax sp.]